MKSYISDLSGTVCGEEQKGCPVYLPHPAPEALHGWKASQREGHTCVAFCGAHKASSEATRGPLASSSKASNLLAGH